MCSWRDNTRQQYRVHINSWLEFCAHDSSLNPYMVHSDTGINFLATLYARGLGYSSINTARAALSSIVTVIDSPGMSFGSHPVVSRFMKGVFNQRPSLPRYTATWDPAVVLDYLKQTPLTGICLPDLTLRLVMLLALCTSQRLQGLKALSLHNACLTDAKCVFYIDVLLKTSRPGCHIKPIEIYRYDVDSELCPVRHVLLYVEMTKSLRKDQTQLLISYAKPHNSVTTDTLSRWLKKTMSAAGINTHVFKAHSTRSASASKAAVKGVPIDMVLSNAGWSNENVFHRFYQRDVSHTHAGQYANNVLSL